MSTINVADKTYVDLAVANMVVGASVNGAGHLILTRQSGATFDAGDFSTAITNLINTVLASANLTNILSSASAAGSVALRAKAFTGQTADIMQWLNSASAILGKVKADGKFAITLDGSTIDGAVNTLSNINATKVDSHKITVNTTAPSTPATGDIWINPNGT